MKDLNVYQIVMNSLTYSMLLTFIFVVAEMIKSEFVFMAQAFVLFFVVSVIYQTLIQKHMREKIYRIFHLNK